MNLTYNYSTGKTARDKGLIKLIIPIVVYL